MADRIFDLNMNKYGMNSTAIAKRGGNIMEKLLMRQARRYMGANTGAKMSKDDFIAEQVEGCREV